MRFAVLALLVSMATECFAADANDRCSFGEGTAARQVAGFQIRIAPHRYKEDVGFPQCLAIIRDQHGKIIFSEHDAGFAVILAGEDVNGDGVPEVVLEAYSGGAHCCWTYYILSLGQRPGVLKVIENQLAVKFEHNERTGRIEMSTWDGAFDYFDGGCHPCSPFPHVFLRLDEKNLMDASAEHLPFYNQQISNIRKELPPSDVERIRSLKQHATDEELQGTELITQKILVIVVAYLYSGREAQARQALQDMWPAFDQERMWDLVMETRQHGILRYTQKQQNEASSGSDPLPFSFFYLPLIRWRL